MEKTGKDKNTNRLKQAWEFVLKYWQKLIEAWDGKVGRTGTQIFMGVASVGVLFYLLDASVDNQLILYLLLFSLTFLALAIVPLKENSDQASRAPIQTRWWISLGIAFVLPVYIAFRHNNFWLIYWRFISLDVLAVPLLLFARQAWYKTWHDNRWLIMPAALIALWWINSSWVITYETSLKWQEKKLYPNPAYNDSVYISYPSIVRFNGEEPPALSIWCDATIVRACNERKIILHTTNGKLLFSEQTDPPVWQLRIPVKLTSPEPQHTLLLQHEAGSVNGPIDLWAIDGGNRQRVGTIHFETKAEAQARTFWLTLLQGGSVAVTVIGTLYAGLKQWDEQKKKEEKEQQKDLIGKIRTADYSDPQKIVRLMNEIHEKLDAVAAWDLRPRIELQGVVKAWILSMNHAPKEIAKTWNKNISSEETKNCADQGYAVLRSLSIDDADFRSLMTEILHMSPDYSWSDSAVRHPPEIYPLRSAFLMMITSPLSEMPQKETLLPTDWSLYANPFGDWDNPFAYGRKDKSPKDDFCMLEINTLVFPFCEERFANQKHYFLSAWDVRAAFYSFCAEFNSASYRPVAQKTLFVSVMPEDWQDGLSLQTYLLHCLAGRWLEILSKTPHVIDELQPSEQERLASLLLWRYRSIAVIRHQIDRAKIDKEKLLNSVTPDFLARLEQPSLAQIPPERDDLLKWLALRPAKNYQTMFLCADVSPKSTIHPVQAALLRSITPVLEQDVERAGIYLARFFKARAHEKRYTTKITDENIILQWMNSRVAHCAQEQNYERAFLALFPNLDMSKFIEKAQGSPGRMVMIANHLLESVAQNKIDPKKVTDLDALPF